jgi:hypothetical protein
LATRDSRCHLGVARSTWTRPHDQLERSATTRASERLQDALDVA